METTAIPSIGKVIRLGEIPWSCLRAGRRGRVLASFSEAIYLLTESGELFWIAANSAPMHRRCLAVPDALPQPRVGSPFHAENGRLTVGRDLVLDTGNVPAWRAQSTKPNDAIPIGRLCSQIQAFFSTLETSVASGFGMFIPSILDLMRFGAPPAPGHLSEPILQAAQPLVLKMVHACLEQRCSLLSCNAERLVGLGPGLTPSGDDFLGGLLFAIHGLQEAYPGSRFAACSMPMEQYYARTHLISSTLLGDLACGHGVEPLHQILRGLLRGDSTQRIHPFVLQLTGLGHSTGWDLLTGLLTGLLVAIRREDPIPSRPIAQAIAM